MRKSAWDNNLAAPGHLLYAVIGAKGLGIEKPSELYVRMSSKNYKEKTKTSKKDMVPVWNDIFYVESCPATLDFSIYSPDGLSEKFWGECACPNLQSLPPEVVVDRWVDVTAGSTKTKRTISGQLQVRFIRTTMPTSRSLTSSSSVELHYEHRRQKKYKSGDLILFSGSGPHHCATRLESGSNYSSVGLLLEMQNRWTKALEWHVLEATENMDELVDPIADSRAPGLRLFRLEERLYNFNGAAVWWLPQATPIDDDAVEIMKRWALSAHDGSKERAFPAQDSKNVEHIDWRQFEQTSERVKLLSDFFERAKSDEPIYHHLHAPQLVGYALASIGIIDTTTTDVANWTMDNVTSHPHFKMSKSRLLRVAQECHAFYTSGDTDKNTLLANGVSFNPASSFLDFAKRIPSDKSFTTQDKQIAGLAAASKVQLTTEESNLLQAASKELIKKKKK